MRDLDIFEKFLQDQARHSGRELLGLLKGSTQHGQRLGKPGVVELLPELHGSASSRTSTCTVERRGDDAVEHALFDRFLRWRCWLARLRRLAAHRLEVGRLSDRRRWPLVANWLLSAHGTKVERPRIVGAVSAASDETTEHAPLVPVLVVRGQEPLTAAG